MKAIEKNRSSVRNTVLIMLVTFALAVLLCCGSAQASFAEEEDEAITVYFTINDKDGYMIGNDPDHTVMCRVPIKLSYVDLADYGLERYYRYRSKSYEEGGTYLPEAIENGDIVKQPTVLMLYLKALSKYYLGREITKDDIGNDEIKAITPTQSATSLFMTTFWGHNFNLLYYVNHEYPLMREGWGATADYILLKDGDTVEVQLMPEMDINGFHKFNIDESSTVQGEEIDMTLYKLGQNLETGSGTTAYPLPYYFIRYSMDYGKTWMVTDTVSDEEGNFTFTCQNAGVCIISSSKASSGISFNYGIPTAILHVTPRQVANGALYTASGGGIKYVFDEVPGAEGYNIFYREQGASEWSTASADTNEFVLENAEAGKVYEFKASAYVTDRYVPDGEPYTILTGEESDVVSYTVSTDPSVLAVADALALVPDAANVQLSDRGVIEAARAAYEVLDSEQRQHIAPSDVTKLSAAEERLAELQAEKDARDKQEATEVTNMITALPSAANVTLDDEEQVTAAYDAYQALSPEGKALIKNISLNKLNAVKAKLDELLEEKAREDASDVTAMIRALPDAGSVSLSDKQTVREVEDAYNGLSDLAKSFVPAAVSSKLNALVEKIDELQREADEAAYQERLIEAKTAGAKSAKTKLTVKALKKLKAQLTWKKASFSYTVDGETFSGTVTGYKIYRATKKNGKYKLIKTIGKAGTLKYTDKGLKKGRKYFYKIQTYTKVSGMVCLGKWSGVAGIKARK